MAIRYSFRTYRYRMPKPLKTQPASTPDHKGVFGQGAKALRAGLYARVSTHDQKTLPLQLAVVRDYAKKRSWPSPSRFKTWGLGPRHDRSGRRSSRRPAAGDRSRPGLAAGSLGAVAGGPDEHDPGTERTRRGIRIPVGSARPDDPSGRALAWMLAVFAEFERDILRDRVKAGNSQWSGPVKGVGVLLWSTIFS